jgi:O-antigen/teichoic acid export membrane protein
MAQGITVALNAGSLAALSRRLGETDLGLYTLERRTMALVQPIVLLGLGVAAPRFIAISLGRSSEDHEFLRTAARLVMAVCGSVAACIIFAFPGPVASLAFGDSQETGLSRALAGFILAMSAFQLEYSILRSYSRILRANLLELAAVGAIPFLISLIGPEDLVHLMWLMNGCIFVAVGLSLAGREGLRPIFSGGISAAREYSIRLLRYGVPRVPGDLAVVSLMALAPLFVVHQDDARSAGYVSVVQSSLNIVSIAAIPLGVILLPHTAREFGLAGRARADKYSMLASAVTDVGFVLAGTFFIASPLVVQFWLPNAPANVVVAQEVATLGVPAYIFYLVFRSYLDAIDDRPLSSIAAVAGLVALLVLLPLLLTADVAAAAVSAAASLAVALSVTGGIVFLFVRRQLAGSLAVTRSAPAFGAFVGMVGLGLVVRDSAPVIVAASVLGATLACPLLLFALRPEWVSELKRRSRSQA